MEAKKERMLYIDNIRLWVIFFVVVMHLAVTYSGFGGWYYKEGRPIGLISSLLFGFYQSFTQGYFMGLLFLVSGYFMPNAYDRKGFTRFIKERFIRLGIPTLLFMLVIGPLVVYFEMDINWQGPKPAFFNYYGHYIKSLDFIEQSGPLWFAFALFVFSIVYGLIRLALRKQSRPLNQGRQKPGLRNIILLILLISTAAFLIRIVQPIGTSIINMQLCYFSQYIILFIVGIYAYRYNWFSAIEYKSGVRSLVVTIILGLVFWLIILLTGGVLKSGMDAFNGGIHWQSAAYALWESFVSVGMAIGLITTFREKFNSQNRFIKILSDNSFAVYVFHTPIIVAITMWFKPVTFLPIVKFIIMCIICIPICFLATHLVLRRIPLLKKVI